MSNVSNVHSFVTYISSGKDQTKAFATQRLAVIRFKKDKDGNKAKDSQAVSIPVAVLSADDMQVLSNQINDWFKTVQDERIRELCVAGESHVTDEQISVEAIKAHLVSAAAGDRLTGEAIKEWFASDLADLLTVAFADKLGFPNDLTEEQGKKLEQMVAVYRDKFASLAGGRTMFDAATRAKLMKALSLLGDAPEGIGAKLVAKLEAMKEPNVEELLGL